MNEELKKYLEEKDIDTTDEKLIKALNANTQSGINGRLAREKKNLTKEIRSELANELGFESFDEIGISLSEAKEEKFNAKVKGVFKDLKIDIKDKYFGDVIAKAGITAETDTKEYKKKVELVKKDYEEMFGSNDDPTLKIPTNPEPISLGAEDIPLDAKGNIDQSKIKDPVFLKMLEITRK